MDTNEMHELLDRYIRGEATEEEKQRLQQGYESKYDRNLEEHIHWESSSKQRLFQRLAEQVPELGRQQATVYRRMMGRRIAALLTVIIGIGILLYVARLDKEERSPRYVAVSNPGGAVKELRLPDGSNVWLNAGSSLKYAERFANDRQVILEGEGFFEVTPDEQHPFVVQTGGLRTTVLGTAFHVKAYPDEGEIAVAVESGSVAVSEQQRKLAMLRPLEQVTYEVISGKAVVGEAEIDDILALKTGEIRFNALPLERIAKVLQRKYGISIQFENERLGNCVYTAAFNESVAFDELLEILCSVNNIEYRFSTNGETVSLLGTGCD